MSDRPQGKMKVQEVDVAAERRKKAVLLALTTTGSAAVLAVGGFLAWYLTPPALPSTVEEAVAVANSPRYKRLSDEDKQPYLDVIREQFGSLNREERRAMLGEDEDARDMARDAMRAMWTERMNAFGAASYEERLAMMEQMPQRPRRPEGERAEGERGEGRDDNAMRNRMSDRMANGNAQGMATMGEFIRSRRAQREREGN